MNNPSSGKDEVKRASWNAQIKSIFLDAKNEPMLSAVNAPEDQTLFYQGDEMIGFIKGDDFERGFFGIWIDEKTPKPGLHRALMSFS